MKPFYGRRSFLVGSISTLALSSLSGAPRRGWFVGTLADRPFDIPLVDKSRIPREFHRQAVTYSGTEAPGTILVDKKRFLLFRVEPGGSAVRYGIAVGRDGQRWNGEAVVGRQERWPTWTPTAN